MSIFLVLLSLLSFAFGTPINRENIKNAPSIVACADGGCVENFR